MDTLDLFNNPVVQEEPQPVEIENDSIDFFTLSAPAQEQEEEEEIIDGQALNIRDNGENSSARTVPPVYYGKAFEYAGLWEVGRMYYNDDYRQTFVKFENLLLACNKTHKSAQALIPVIQYDNIGNPVAIENIYWTIVLNGAATDVDYEAIQRILADMQDDIDDNAASISNAVTSINTLGTTVTATQSRVTTLETGAASMESDIDDIKETINTSPAYGWIGTEDQYEALTEIDPTKFYYIYEE